MVWQVLRGTFYYEDLDSLDNFEVLYYDSKETAYVESINEFLKNYPLHDEDDDAESFKMVKSDRKQAESLLEDAKHSRPMERTYSFGSMHSSYWFRVTELKIDSKIIVVT